MTVEQLIRELQKLPQDLIVGSSGHFGELDRNLDGVRVATNRVVHYSWRKKNKEPKEFVELVGMPASYEEPY